MKSYSVSIHIEALEWHLDLVLLVVPDIFQNDFFLNFIFLNFGDALKWENQTERIKAFKFWSSRQIP